MVVSPQSPASETQSVQVKKNNMASKQTSVADTRAELAELVKRKAEVAVCITNMLILYVLTFRNNKYKIHFSNIFNKITRKFFGLGNFS